MKTITVRLPESLIRAAKVHAAQTDRRIQAVIAAALSDYLKKAGKEVK